MDTERNPETRRYARLFNMNYYAQSSAKTVEFRN